MIQGIIHRILRRRHFWRYATFSEVAELYASRTMRIFALRLVAVFTSVYLYQLGYSIATITCIWAAFFLYKTIVSWPAAKLIARIGPKHGTFISNILAAVSLFFLPFVPEYGLWAIAVWGVIQASSTCLYDMCYLIDFSKVKNAEHAGKEIAYMNMFEKIATGVAPVIGGIIASLINPEVVMFVSAGFFLLAAVPLFKTAEPVKVRQKIEFRGFPWKLTWRSLRAEAAVGFDTYATGNAWVLFIAVVVFAGNGEEIYAKIGALLAVTLIAALIASYAFGRLIDSRRGRELLQYSVGLNAFTHAVRMFVTTPIGVVFTNIFNEFATTGYTMSFTRGLFDTADATGRRIVYLFFVEVALNFGSALAAVALAILVLLLGDVQGLQAFFVVTAFIVLIIGTPRFALYRNKQ